MTLACGILIRTHKELCIFIQRSWSKFENPVPILPIIYLHGEPRIVWEEAEVIQMIHKEKLKYAVVGKFSYGMPEIKELRRIIPTQCELKGDCNIGVLGLRHA